MEKTSVPRFTELPDERLFQEFMQLYTLLFAVLTAGLTFIELLVSKDVLAKSPDADGEEMAG